MANVNFAIKDRALAADRLSILAGPVFFGMSDEAPSRDWAVLGAKVAVFRIHDVAASVEGVGLVVNPGFSVRDVAPSADRASLTNAILHQVFFTMRDVAESADAARLVGLIPFTIHDEAPSVDRADFAAAIPVVRRPEPGETWGTVNLARNPSLEYDQVGLTDWSAGAGITLTRTSAVDAWTGTHVGRAVIAATSGTPQIIIVSQAGLAQRGYGRRWVDSVALRGDAATVTMWLELVYTDATTTIGAVTTIDSAADRPLNADWWRYNVEPVNQDPTKTLDRLDVVLAVPADAVLDFTLDIDGVQPEEALSGGSTAYADGDQGPGHYWVGTPGFSISARETM